MSNRRAFVSPIVTTRIENAGIEGLHGRPDAYTTPGEVDRFAAAAAATGAGGQPSA